MNNETIFDKILRHEVPAERIYEDDHVVAFKDVNPTAPTHVLVIPKVRLRNMIDVRHADPTAVGHFLRGVSLTAEALGLEANGYRVVFNTGADALQTVEYLHAHIIAGRKMSWPPG